MSMNDSSSEYTGDAATKDDYSSRQGQKGEVPVVSDDTKIDDPIDADTADSDKQLEADEKEAIDESNIVDERTRGAKPSGSYAEPGDEEGLPTDDGTSSGA